MCTTCGCGAATLTAQQHAPMRSCHSQGLIIRCSQRLGTLGALWRKGSNGGGVLSAWHCGGGWPFREVGTGVGLLVHALTFCCGVPRNSNIAWGQCLREPVASVCAGTGCATGCKIRCTVVCAVADGCVPTATRCLSPRCNRGKSHACATVNESRRVSPGPTIHGLSAKAEQPHTHRQHH